MGSLNSSKRNPIVLYLGGENCSDSSSKRTKYILVGDFSKECPYMDLGVLYSGYGGDSSQEGVIHGFNFP